MSHSCELQRLLSEAVSSKQCNVECKCIDHTQQVTYGLSLGTEIGYFEIWMILHCVRAVTLRYFTEFCTVANQLIHIAFFLFSHHMVRPVTFCME